jgi:hypothetical protein
MAGECTLGAGSRIQCLLVGFCLLVIVQVVADFDLGLVLDQGKGRVCVREWVQFEFYSALDIRSYIKNICLKNSNLNPNRQPLITYYWTHEINELFVSNVGMLITFFLR